jgi:F-type H+-transporting ATPase subunit delta
MNINKQARQQARKLFQSCRVNGLLDANRVRLAVRRLLAAGYRESPAVLSVFLRLVRLDAAQHTAQIESATEPSADLRAEIEALLSRRYGPGLTTSFIHAPSLIGGIRIRVGSDLFDGSLAGRLEELEKRF